MAMQRLLQVENITRRTIIGNHVQVASSLRDRTVGLLGTAELSPKAGLLIERSPSIHMFLMAYAIDAIFVDRSQRVVKVVPGLRPWRVVWWARGARDCLELPVGTISASRTEVGDNLVYHAADP